MTALLDMIKNNDPRLAEAERAFAEEVQEIARLSREKRKERIVTRSRHKPPCGDSDARLAWEQQWDYNSEKIEGWS